MGTYSIDLDHLEEFVRRLSSAFELLHETSRPEIFVDQSKLVAEGYGGVVQLREKGSKVVWHHYPTDISRRVAELLESLGGDLEDPNFKDTPRRVAKYLRSHFCSRENIWEEVRGMSESSFPSSYDGIITVGPTRAFGICPHHLLPVIYEITVAYIPQGSVIGLSKLVRVPKLLAQLPDLQEDITYGIAETFKSILWTRDVAVLVEGQHQCMQVRGVEEGAVTTTSVMMGRFKEDEGGCKKEFFDIVQRRSK